MVQQKAQLPSPNPEEDTNFFDDMAPKVHKQKKVNRERALLDNRTVLLFHSVLESLLAA